jgi:type II secretory pathway pseudopilin PulG
VLRIQNKKGFASVVEVIITSVIFIIASIGIFSTLSTVGQEGAVSQRKLQAIYRAKSVLDEMRSQLNTTTWASGDLSTSTMHQRYIIDPETYRYYTVNWTVADVPGLDVREVTITTQY